MEQNSFTKTDTPRSSRDKAKSRAAIYAAKIMHEVEALERQGGSYDINAAVDEAAARIKY